jgi:hypothetical protein
LENLVTTYQQFPNIQRKYQDLKPIMDLAEKAKVQINNVLPLLELGIQTYAKQAGIIDGRQPVSDATHTPAKVGGYQGPFKDQEEDDYYKEVDATMHGIIQRLHAGNQGSPEVASLRAEIDGLKTQMSAPAPQDEAQAQEAFEGKIKGWSGDHTDYFSAPNVGEVRLNAFKNFIVKSHSGSGLKIKDLTAEFLSGEFARFDPKYNLAYMEGLAQKKVGQAKDDSGMFAEGTGVRSTVAPLDEQQEHMTDML